MSYAVQHRANGHYVHSNPATPTLEPHQAYLFVSRRAAQQYIDRNVLADEYVVATLPDTRTLLSEPGVFSCV